MSAGVTEVKIQGVTVCATWDPEAQVFFATSADVPGLVLEANTIDEIESEAILIIPTLLEALDPNGRREITISTEMAPRITKIAV